MERIPLHQTEAVKKFRHREIEGPNHVREMLFPPPMEFFHSFTVPRGVEFRQPFIKFPPDFFIHGRPCERVERNSGDPSSALGWQ